MATETERQGTERQRDRETERQRDRETERQRDRETERQRDRETERQRDRETERQRESERITQSSLNDRSGSTRNRRQWRFEVGCVFIHFFFHLLFSIITTFSFSSSCGFSNECHFAIAFFFFDRDSFRHPVIIVGLFFGSRHVAACFHAGQLMGIFLLEDQWEKRKKIDGEGNRRGR